MDRPDYSSLIFGLYHAGRRDVLIRGVTLLRRMGFCNPRERSGTPIRLGSLSLMSQSPPQPSPHSTHPKHILLSQFIHLMSTRLRG